MAGYGFDEPVLQSCCALVSVGKGMDCQHFPAFSLNVLDPGHTRSRGAGDEATGAETDTKKTTVARALATYLSWAVRFLGEHSSSL